MSAEARVPYFNKTRWCTKGCYAAPLTWREKNILVLCVKWVYIYPIVHGFERKMCSSARSQLLPREIFEEHMQIAHFS